jgi:hypothetical protein
MDGKKCLVTFSNWFHAPDGQVYKAAWGKITILTEKRKTVGFSADIVNESYNRIGCNDIQIGDGDKSLIVSGSLIQFVLECSDIPKQLEGTYTLKGDSRQHINNSIYIAG